MHTALVILDLVWDAFLVYLEILLLHLETVLLWTTSLTLIAFTMVLVWTFLMCLTLTCFLCPLWCFLCPWWGLPVILTTTEALKATLALATFFVHFFTAFLLMVTLASHLASFFRRWSFSFP